MLNMDLTVHGDTLLFKVMLVWHSVW